MTVAVSEDRRFVDVKRRYDRDGFVILRGYLGQAEVTALRKHAEPTARKLIAERGQGAGKFGNVVKGLHQHSPWFADQLQAGRHVPLMRALIGDEVAPATAAWFDRPIGCEEVIEPHIDGIGRARGERVGATIWFAIDAAGPDNGCLYYGPGTHLVEHPTGIPIPGFDTANGVAAAMAPGDAVVHDALTVHWSGANLSERPRRAVSFFYWGAQARAKEIEKGKRKAAGDDNIKEKRRWPK